MDSQKYNFLKAVLGAEGADALKKAAVQIPALENALVPRAIMAWLDVASRVDYEGEIPGINNTYIQFQKSNDKFQGSIIIGDDTYNFNDASIYHLAASVAVSIGIDEDKILLKNYDLVRLGKSIDLMAKAHILVTNGFKLEKTNHEQPTMGSPAKHREPVPPTQPLQPQAKQYKIPSLKSPKPHSLDIKRPKTSVEKVSLPKITLHEKHLSVECNVCGGTQFKNNELVGCICFKDLMTNTILTKNNNSYVLTFGSDWDVDAIDTFIDTIGLYDGRR